jgi:hypothetical protein
VRERSETGLSQRPHTSGRMSARRRSMARRIKVHDRHQFELKLEYHPSAGDEGEHHELDVFMFVPRALNVESSNVQREDLWADLQNYIRLKTPMYGWGDLQKDLGSPLVLLEAEIGRGATDEKRFVALCRLFGACFRATLRETARRMKDPIPADGITAEALDEITAVVDDGLAAARAVLGRYRSHRTAIGPKIGERARAAYALVEEYTSVSIEVVLRRAIVGLARVRTPDELAARSRSLRERILDLMIEEEQVRRKLVLPTIIDPKGDNEAYLARVGLLKKYCSGVLFLSVEQRAIRRRWQEVAFAIAAGIAMAFATLVAFWAQAFSVGLNLFILLVVGYMFKDRIKEAARSGFARLLEKHLFDREIVVEDGAGRKLGQVREKIAFISPEEVPDEVRQARRRGMDPIVQIAEGEMRESIIRYEKEVDLDVRTLSRQRHAGLTDILRFNVDRFLHDMDEPEEEIEYVDRDTHALTCLRASKTYRIDAVVRLDGDVKGKGQTLLYRLILDRNGIKRMERLES